MLLLEWLIWALLRTQQPVCAAKQVSIPDPIQENHAKVSHYALSKNVKKIWTPGSVEWEATETDAGTTPILDVHALQKRFFGAKTPSLDDRRVSFMNAQCNLRGILISSAITWQWVTGWCDEEGNVRIKCGGLGYPDREPETFYHCTKSEVCLVTYRWKNFKGEISSMAMCVPRTWNRLMEKVKKFGRWRSGLMCGIGGIATESGVRSAMVEMAVQVHRRPVPESQYSDDIKADQVFMWDVTHGAYDLLGEEDKVSRASVAIALQHGHPRYIKCCVTIPDYWQLRQDEVWVNFTHSYQYNKVMMTRELPNHLLHPTTILNSKSTAI